MRVLNPNQCSFSETPLSVDNIRFVCNQSAHARVRSNSMTSCRMADTATILVLGLGNTLLSDDGVGVHVVTSLQQTTRHDDNIIFVDGGTIGLNLLPDVEAANGLILVDASEIGAAPGTVATFEGAAMDAQLGGKKRTPHEVAAFDLIATASLLGRCPQLRALVAVQPQSVTWGLEPTAPVAAAIPAAERAVSELLHRWRADAGEAATSGADT